jgi:hypothetical protein
MLFINLEFKKPAQSVVSDVISVLRKMELIVLFVACLILGLSVEFVVLEYLTVGFRICLGLHRELFVLAAARSGRFEIFDGFDDHRGWFDRDTFAGTLRSHYQEARPRQRDLHRICVLRHTFNRVLSHLQSLAVFDF